MLSLPLRKSDGKFCTANLSGKNMGLRLRVRQARYGVLVLLQGANLVIFGAESR